MISEHISNKEAYGSPTAKRLNIENIPNDDQLRNMQRVAFKVFEPLRNHFGKPIKIESFFRSYELNKAIGGSPNSQHMKGEAIDIDDDFGYVSNYDMFYWIAENLNFDQLIYEFGNKHNPAWVHVSLKESGNRKKISIAFKSNGYTKYKHFYNLVDFELFKNKIYP
jgi:hypothetical protein